MMPKLFLLLFILAPYEIPENFPQAITYKKYISLTLQISIKLTSFNNNLNVSLKSLDIFK